MKKFETAHYSDGTCEFDFHNMIKRNIIYKIDTSMRIGPDGLLRTELGEFLYLDTSAVQRDVDEAYQRFILEKYLLEA